MNPCFHARCLAFYRAGCPIHSSLHRAFPHYHCSCDCLPTTYLELRALSRLPLQRSMDRADSGLSRYHLSIPTRNQVPWMQVLRVLSSADAAKNLRMCCLTPPKTKGSSFLKHRFDHRGEDRLSRPSKPPGKTLRVLQGHGGARPTDIGG